MTESFCTGDSPVTFFMHSLTRDQRFLTLALERLLLRRSYLIMDGMRSRLSGGNQAFLSTNEGHFILISSNPLITLHIRSKGRNLSVDHRERDEHKMTALVFICAHWEGKWHRPSLFTWGQGHTSCAGSQQADENRANGHRNMKIKGYIFHGRQSVSDESL